MDRIAYHQQEQMTTFEILETFGEAIEVIYRNKKKELIEEMFSVYEEIDWVNNKNWNDEDKKMAIWYIEASLPSQKRILLKSVKELERLRNMYKRRYRGEGLAVMPLEEIKQIPIMDIFAFKKIKRIGKRTMVSCPLHKDDSPSMIINSNNTFKCFSCQKSGSIIDLVKNIYGFDFVSSVKWLQGKLQDKNNEIK